MGEQYHSCRPRRRVAREPRVFAETGNKERVFFVESVSRFEHVQNVFVASVSRRQGVSIAAPGIRSGPNATLHLARAGRRYEGSRRDDTASRVDRYARASRRRRARSPK